MPKSKKKTTFEKYLVKIYLMEYLSNCWKKYMCGKIWLKNALSVRMNIKWKETGVRSFYRAATPFVGTVYDSSFSDQLTIK